MVAFVTILLLTIVAWIISINFKFKGENSYASVVGMLALLCTGMLIMVCINGYRTDWGEPEYVYLQEVIQGEYVIQVDNGYIYRIKYPDENILDTEQIYLGKRTQVEFEYFEDENDDSYLAKSTRYERFDLYTKYVFYIPKTE